MTAQACCKVGIVTDRYDLDATETRYGSVDERLVTRWVGADDADPAGYRSLAEWFNRRLLKTVYDEHGRDTTGTRLDSDFEALSSDDDLLAAEVEDDLAADGIDANRVAGDMVSWSAIRTHLRDCLDAEKPDTGPPTDWERESVVVAKHVTRQKVTEALRSLDNKDRLPGGADADVGLQVLLSCPDCPTRIPFTDAIERGFVCETHLGVTEER